MHRPVVVVVTNVSVWVARVGCHQSQPASVTVKNTMQLQIVLTREEGRRAFRILVPTIHSMGHLGICPADKARATVKLLYHQLFACT